MQMSTGTTEESESCALWEEAMGCRGGASWEVLREIASTSFSWRKAGGVERPPLGGGDGRGSFSMWREAREAQSIAAGRCEVDWKGGARWEGSAGRSQPDTREARELFKVAELDRLPRVDSAAQ